MDLLLNNHINVKDTCKYMGRDSYIIDITISKSSGNDL